MASTSRSVLAPTPTPVPAAPRRAAVGRAPRVRPGGRPVVTDGLAVARPVRGGCAAQVPGPSSGEWGAPDAPAPLRLTERGRRVVAGLSISIGLCIAAGTAVTVELGGADGELQLAGVSTVVVQPGDTLWDIARSVAPEEDPRAVVDAIVELNGLHSVDLMPGAELQLP